MQKAGGLDQAKALFGGAFEQGFEEGEEFLAEARNAGLGHFCHPRGLDQRVAGAQAVGHLLEKEALADAIGGDVDFRRFQDADDLAQDLAGEGDQFHPLGAGAGAAAQGGKIGGRQPVERGQQAVGRHAVFMEDGQRVIPPLHVQPGDDAP